MNSRIFTGHVTHKRLLQRVHELRYPLYVYAIDLDELTALDKSLPLFGYNRLRPVSIHDGDYLMKDGRTIREKLLAFLEPRGFADRVTSITLITSARYFTYVFNPVSFYYCFGDDGTLVCTAAEVNNTFGDRHLYIPRAEDAEGSGFPRRFRAPKEFHVSPFNDMAGTYEFIFADIRKELSIRINLYRGEELAFYAELEGTPLPLTAGNHTRLLLTHPLVPSLTIPRIHWEAARLFFGKGLSYHARPIPVSPMTIGRTPPTSLQRQCMKLIVRLLDGIDEGCLTMTLPDGTLRRFGNPASPMTADLSILDYRFFSRVVLGGDIGLGESFMAGEWKSSDVVETVKLFIQNQRTLSDGNFATVAFGRLRDILLHLARENTRFGARWNVTRHYDLGNDFFETYLDPSMTYSCALFRSPGDTLEAAQHDKFTAIIEKAGITGDDHVLEIGCGWGGFACEAAKGTGCRVTAITISEKQYAYTRERVRREGLDGSITVLLRDYREMTGTFDRIVSIEMLEAVGHRYLGTFFATCDRLLKGEGRVVLQTITIPDRDYHRYRRGMDWIRKHIFPGGHLPSRAALTKAMTDHSALTIADAEEIGLHYARTLRAWRERFITNEDTLSAMGLSRSFQRKWLYYFSCCEAAFAVEKIGNLQLVLHRGDRNLTP